MISYPRRAFLFLAPNGVHGFHDFSRQLSTLLSRHLMTSTFVLLSYGCVPILFLFRFLSLIIAFSLDELLGEAIVGRCHSAGDAYGASPIARQPSNSHSTQQYRKR